MHLSGTKIRSRLISWQIISAAVIFILAVAYVKQINNQAEFSYVIRNLEQVKSDYETQIRDLTWEASAQQSLAQVQVRAEQLNLQKPNSVTFLEVGLSTVAALDETQVQ